MPAAPERSGSRVTRRKVLTFSMMMAMGVAVPGEAQQPPPVGTPAPADTAGVPPVAGGAPAAGQPAELPSSLAELRDKGKETLESIVQVSDQLRNMAMVAKQEGDLVRAECVGSKRQHARVLVNTGWEQMGKIDEALKVGDGLRATYSFMTLDTTRTKAQELMAEAHACMGTRGEETGSRVEVQGGGGPENPSDLQPVQHRPLDRPPAASPYK